MLYCKNPNVGYFKYNSNGSTKGYHGQSSRGFCIRDSKDEFIYAEARRLQDGYSMQSTTTHREWG